MRRRLRQELLHGDGYHIKVVGVRAPGLRDLYHWLMRIPWWSMAGLIVGAYLALNALFALLYVIVGGVQNAAPGSFADAFFFSVQTMGTIGYGGMLPVTPGANAVVVAESVVALAITAISTGLVFVRFSQTRARMVFATKAAIGPVDGVPTLSVRLGNDRRSAIVDASFRMVLSTTVTLAEGQTFYRSQELALVRDRASQLARAWIVMHRIDAASPLAGISPERLRELDAEISMSVLGLDELSMQAVYARHVWSLCNIVYGARLADILSEDEAGNITLDLRRFHDLVPTSPIDGFPWTWSTAAGTVAAAHVARDGIGIIQE